MYNHLTPTKYRGFDRLGDMTTRKQIEANRRNSRKSTGPSTRAGKADSKMNAIKHGLLAKQIVVHQEWVNLPATFIVDRKGILRWAKIGRGWPMSERASPEEILSQLERMGE